MFKYGSDKPDLRVPLEFTELTDIMKDVSFKVFREARKNPMAALPHYAFQKAASYRARRLTITPASSRYTAPKAWPISKSTIWPVAWKDCNPRFEIPAGSNDTNDPYRTKAQDGDLIFFGADKTKIVNESLGALRIKIGHQHGFAEPGWKPLWVVDFPMFEFDDEENRWKALHHPFTSPADGHDDLLETDPGKALSKAYDMVLNGSEIGGGSVRIHRQECSPRYFAH